MISRSSDETMFWPLILLVFTVVLACKVNQYCHHIVGCYSWYGIGGIWDMEKSCWSLQISTLKLGELAENSLIINPPPWICWCVLHVFYVSQWENPENFWGFLGGQPCRGLSATGCPLCGVRPSGLWCSHAKGSWVCHGLFKNHGFLYNIY